MRIAYFSGALISSLAAGSTYTASIDGKYSSLAVSDSTLKSQGHGANRWFNQIPDLELGRHTIEIKGVFVRFLLSTRANSFQIVYDDGAPVANFSFPLSTVTSHLGGVTIHQVASDRVSFELTIEPRTQPPTGKTYQPSTGLFISASQPVELTYNQLLVSAKSLNVSNGENLNAIAQIEENVGRNDITIDQAKDRLRLIIDGAQSSRENEESNGDMNKNLENLPKLITNYSIILNQLKLLFDNVFDAIEKIKKENIPERKQQLKDLFQNTVLVSITRGFNNLALIETDFNTQGLTIPQDLLSEKNVLMQDQQEITILLGAIIDESPSLLIIAGFPVKDWLKVVM